MYINCFDQNVLTVTRDMLSLIGRMAPDQLRDIEARLRVQQSTLYHMGIGMAVSRSTLADVNQQRDLRIYADFAQSLIKTARSCMQRKSWDSISTLFYRFKVLPCSRKPL